MTAAKCWKPVALFLAVGGVTLALPFGRPADGAEPEAKPAAADAKPEADAERPSLLTNGGVEEGEEAPEAWTEGNKVPGVEYVWSRDAGHGDSKSSLGFKKTIARYFPIAGWSQTIDREGDAPRLKVAAWVKAEKAGKAVLDVQFVDGDGKWRHAWAAYIGAKEASDPPASHDWKLYEGVVEIPPGTEKIVVAPQMCGPGTVWFDDITAEYTTDPAIDPTKS